MKVYQFQGDFLAVLSAPSHSLRCEYVDSGVELIALGVEQVVEPTQNTRADSVSFIPVVGSYEHHVLLEIDVLEDEFVVAMGLRH